ncbi:suppressor of fused domain protein [Methylomonas koyamae]|uniref:suppressor of fused domain protein n=1 Tax=Methylomonas koyamae TaxID=702114 RepID=UPI0028735D48|nr:suppressor of fused domain protein [Methylomonas koyamae]WNB76607.1 suppressor of fused domain protein [Methylomonas koyamae]
MPNNNIIEHVESYLGEIDQGWNAPPESKNRFSVARFRNQPVEGMSTYVTLGLNHHILLMKKIEIRQELVFSVFESVPSDEIVSFLFRLIDLILSKHEALLRGQVIGPGKPLFSESPMNAIYTSMPVIFEEGFNTFNGSSPPTILVWLIPIFESEARYVQEYGWEAFEDILEKEDPDLWDLKRLLVID